MIRINLLGDRHFKDRLVIRQQVSIATILFVISFIACGVFYSFKINQISGIEEDIVVAKKELEALKKIRDEVDKLEKYERNVKAILKSIEFLKKIRTGPTIYLDHLNVLMPSEIWLTSISDSGAQLKVQGYSFSNNAVAKFMKELEKSEEFVSVELTGLIKAKLAKAKKGADTAQGNIMKFNLICTTKLGQRIAEAKAKEEADAQKGKKGRKGKKGKKGKKKK